MPEKLKKPGKIGKVVKFLKEVRGELAMVTWPTASELKGTTLVVIITTFAITVFIGVADLGLATFIGKLIR